MFETLLEATLRSSIIAAAAALALPLLRVRAAAIRHRVWTVVLLAMLVLPAWTAWGPQIALPVLPLERSAPTRDAVVPPLASAPLADVMAPPPPVAATSAAATATEPILSAAAPERSALQAWLVSIYLAGVMLLAARLVLGMARVRKLVREARVVSGNLTSAQLATPVAVGVLRPRVLLPEGWQHWPHARLAAVLEHERAHVLRRDSLVQWLALLNRAVFWFNPLAWWLERHLSALAEQACDATVLARGHEPAEYSDGLLELARAARRRPATAVIGMAMPGSALGVRIAQILGGTVPRVASRRATACAVGVAALAAAGLGAVTLVQGVASQPATEPSTPLPEQWFSDDEWHFEVATLMTQEEREAYRQLRTMEERDLYIGAFWTRRDPTPGTLHNELRKEHERRIHYAHQEWGSPSTYGYQTTRGGAYVLFGEPDSIESVIEGDFPAEYWRYSGLDGLLPSATIRVAAAGAGNFGCGPGSGFEIVAPAPAIPGEGATALGRSGERIAVRVYPGGLVTMSIPTYHVRHIVTTLERGAGPALHLGEFYLANPQAVRRPDIPWVTLDSRLSCTRRMPPGRYRLVTAIDLHTGQRVTDGVAFEVTP
jgi:GWxTD domain-containing protein